MATGSIYRDEVAFDLYCETAAMAEKVWEDTVSELEVKATAENALTIANSAEEVFRIRGDGALFWRGREVETDEELRRALLEAAAVLSGQQRFELEQAEIARLRAALKRYGVHESACPWLEGGACNCGFEAYA